MTIKIIAKDLNSSQAIEIIRFCNKIILNGNYGSYTSNDQKLSIVLHLKELSSEIVKILSSLEQNIIEFSCGPTEVEVSEDFGITEISGTNSEKQPNEQLELVFENTDEIQAEIEAKTETEAETETEIIADETNDDSKCEEQNNQESPIVSEPKAVNVGKQAVLEMFKDVSYPKNPEEIADEVIKHLHLEKHFYKKSLNNISKAVIAFVKAPVKPTSCIKLQELLDFNLYCQTTTKLNFITRKAFSHYNTSVTFLECLTYLCEKLSGNSEESEDSNDSEEVILSPPEKPPDKKLKTPGDLIEFIYALDPEFSIAERIQKLVDFMGLNDFEKYNRLTVEKCFVSIITNRTTNLEELFSFDPSLKRYSTSRGAMKVLIRFIGNFFKKDVNEDFVIEFFKDLINNFSESFAVKHLQKKSVSFKKTSFNEEKEQIRQEPGELRCFPKNKEFDAFIRKEVKNKKLNRMQKVIKILKYMEVQKLPKATSKTICKVCCNPNVLYFRNPGYMENIPTAEIEIVENFVNNFAKTLKYDAKYIRLQNFFTSLRLLL